MKSREKASFLQEATRERQKEHSGTAPGRKANTGGKFPQVSTGKTRDKVAAYAGRSGRTLQSEAVAIAEALWPKEQQAARERQAQAGPTEGRGNKSGSGKFPEAVQGQTRDKVAAYTGRSGRTLQSEAVAIAEALWPKEQQAARERQKAQLKQGDKKPVVENFHDGAIRKFCGFVHRPLGPVPAGCAFDRYKAIARELGVPWKTVEKWHEIDRKNAVSEKSQNPPAYEKV